jgi:hypothetical protein
LRAPEILEKRCLTASKSSLLVHGLEAQRLPVICGQYRTQIVD